MPPDEHESAAAAWLDLPETQREIAIVQRRFKDWSSYEVAQFVLSMQMLVALEVYGSEEIEIDPNQIILPEIPDEDPPEPWRDSDASGWKP
jgi:hypothetical protein